MILTMDIKIENYKKSKNLFLDLIVCSLINSQSFVIKLTLRRLRLTESNTHEKLKGGACITVSGLGSYYRSV